MISAGTSRRFVASSSSPVLDGPAVFALRPPRFAYGRQRVLQGGQSGVVPDASGLAGELGDDLGQRLGIEEAGGLGERSD